MHPLRKYLLGFSQIFLQNDLRFGLIILASIAFASPRLLPGALLGAITGPLAARLLKRPREEVDSGLYGYNAILLGLLLPFQFQWSTGLALLILAASTASVLVQSLLLRQSILPAYTAAFVGLGWLLLELGDALSLPKATAAACWSCLVAQLDAVALGVSEVIFLDEPLTGVLLWGGLLLTNRRGAAWALAGSAGALLIAHFAALPSASAQAGLLGLNGTLAGIALGRSLARPWVGIGAVLLAVLLQPAIASLGVMPLTAPFVLACWIAIAGQRLLLRVDQRNRSSGVLP
ncbi:Urea transporter [compost metagenome]